ncbi:peptide chain release factor N(5)-glutamine methyltransferase [Leucobacter aridicollis]|nr:peptide chain release factor N(5)-glutamine methyltransferase [Leucobacter aridicollis]MBL3681449.1 peptide chain release factor N(5)-glutamine methyltransferase [Leucobacter aridicollis]
MLVLLQRLTRTGIPQHAGPAGQRDPVRENGRVTDTLGPQIDHALRAMRDAFSEAGIVDPEVDAELLVAHVLDVSRGRVQTLAIMGERLTEADGERLRDLAELRASRLPLQHLTGRAPFRSLELRVGPGVFVPRPETETVAQFAIDALALAPTPEPLAVDLCTGSGAIALALASEVPTARVWAVEKSADAHAWAAENVAALGDGRVDLIHGDLADFVPGRLAPAELAGRVNVVVSNPPYVPAAMVPRDPEVRDHDPDLALYGGDDGLDVIRIISRIAANLLAPGGALVLEHAEGQGAAIRELLAADGWRASATHPDLTGRDRATTALK